MSNMVMFRRFLIAALEFLFSQEFLLLGFLLVALAVMSGCATEQWIEKPHGAPLPYEWVVVSPNAAQILCSIPGRMATRSYPIAACANWNYNYALCVIVAQTPEAETPKWIVDHERKHCAGFDHP